MGWFGHSGQRTFVAKCITMEIVADSNLPEVVGALYVVQFCKEVVFFFFFYVLFEGDSKTLVKKKLIQLLFFFNLKSANSLKISMMSCKA